ncbi:MAG: rhomboid family intramembrane serine protease [Candidatus ainarchaeum sp.]|nr:rhomboid family intramembrane serine protease [Candidatus ainarchaeum sp.]
MIYLLAAMAIAFILQQVFPGFTELFYLDPSKPLEIWRLVTSIFMHAGIEHIFFNALSLFFFAPVLMRMAGKSELYKIFFIGGIVGNLLYLAFVFAGISPPVPALGASGAIYAVLGAVAMFAPNSVVYMYFFPMRMKYAVAFWVLLNLFYVSPIGQASGIGGAAHLGGLFFGLIYAYYLKGKRASEWTYSFPAP